MLSNYEVLALLNEMDEKQTLQAKSEPNIKFAENLKTVQFEVMSIINMSHHIKLHISITIYT